MLTVMFTLSSSTGTGLTTPVRVEFAVDGDPDSGWVTVSAVGVGASRLLAVAVVFAGVCVVDCQHRVAGSWIPY